MSSRIHDGLADLGRDVAVLRIPSPAAVRARGEALHRRRVVAGVATAAAGVALTGVVAVPLLQPDDRPGPGPGNPTPSGTSAACAPFTAPTAIPSWASLRVAVFFTDAASPAQQAAVAAELESMPQVASFAFEDHHSAYERFSEIYRCAPELVAATKPDALPESFQVTLRYPGDAATVAERLRTMPGVDTVVHLPQ